MTAIALEWIGATIVVGVVLRKPSIGPTNGFDLVPRLS
jgi:hypothetical protein